MCAINYDSALPGAIGPAAVFTPDLFKARVRSPDSRPRLSLRPRRADAESKSRRLRCRVVGIGSRGLVQHECDANRRGDGGPARTRRCRPHHRFDRRRDGPDLRENPTRREVRRCCARNSGSGGRETALRPASSATFFLRGMASTSRKCRSSWTYAPKPAQARSCRAAVSTGGQRRSDRALPAREPRSESVRAEGLSRCRPAADRGVFSSRLGAESRELIT